MYFVKDKKGGGEKGTAVLLHINKERLYKRKGKQKWKVLLLY